MTKFQYFNGVKFTRDDKTGYYLNSTIRKRMHRYVWEYYNGEIKKGYQIHHKDKNRWNNDINNLECLPTNIHEKMHAEERVKEHYDEMKKNLIENAIPKANKWHKSEDGRTWHKEHYETMKDKMHIEKEMVCEMCGKKYTGEINGNNRFCSNKCKSAYRRKSGVDDIERVCEICGKSFKTNKYSKVTTCSIKCRNKKIWKIRKSKES